MWLSNMDEHDPFFRWFTYQNWFSITRAANEFSSLPQTRLQFRVCFTYWDDFLMRLYNVCKIVSNWDVSPTSSLNVGYKRNVTSPVGTNRHGKIFTENWGWKIGSSGWIHQAGHLDIFHPQMASPPVFFFTYCFGLMWLKKKCLYHLKD